VAECLFCAIVAGEIPATTVLETDRILAFRDINPQAPTHVLVISKAHYPDVAALAAADAALLGEVINAAQQVVAAEGVDETGYRIVFNTGAQAGQTVSHVHGHILGGRLFTWPPG
jgi:histidine triad (HIT) family protein